MSAVLLLSEREKRGNALDAQVVFAFAFGTVIGLAFP